MEKSGELHAPAALSLVEATVLVEREAGWAPEPVWTVWEKGQSPAHAGIATRTAPSETIKRLIANTSNNAVTGYSFVKQFNWL